MKLLFARKFLLALTETIFSNCTEYISFRTCIFLMDCTSCTMFPTRNYHQRSKYYKEEVKKVDKMNLDIKLMFLPL